jgi:hypothetical protein
MVNYKSTFLKTQHLLRRYLHSKARAEDRKYQV